MTDIRVASLFNHSNFRDDRAAGEVSEVTCVTVSFHFASSSFNAASVASAASSKWHAAIAESLVAASMTDMHSSHCMCDKICFGLTGTYKYWAVEKLLPWGFSDAGNLDEPKTGFAGLVIAEIIYGGVRCWDFTASDSIVLILFFLSSSLINLTNLAVNSEESLTFITCSACIFWATSCLEVACCCCCLVGLFIWPSAPRVLS